jgi:hypothetical protein
VQVARVDAELVRELAIRQLVPLLGPERLEDAQPEWVSERLQLVGTMDLEELAHAV